MLVGLNSSQSNVIFLFRFDLCSSVFDPVVSTSDNRAGLRVFVCVSAQSHSQGNHVVTQVKGIISHTHKHELTRG